MKLRRLFAVKSNNILCIGVLDSFDFFKLLTGWRCIEWCHLAFFLQNAVSMCTAA